jgi:hypothetical protein
MFSRSGSSIETLERCERLRDHKTNCCVRALSILTHTYGCEPPGVPSQRGCLNDVLAQVHSTGFPAEFPDCNHNSKGQSHKQDHKDSPNVDHSQSVGHRLPLNAPLTPGTLPIHGVGPPSVTLPPLIVVHLNDTLFLQDILFLLYIVYRLEITT